MVKKKHLNKSHFNSSPFVASLKNHASATTTTMVTVPDRAVNTHTSAADVLGSIPRKTAMDHQSQTKEFMEPPINNRTQPTKSENEVSLNPGVVTPVNVKAFEMWLQGYDSAKSKFLLDGFTFGFKILQNCQIRRILYIKICSLTLFLKCNKFLMQLHTTD